MWDYPRPPRVERTTALIEIHLDGVLVARTTRAFRVLETSHPPTYYLPPGDFAADTLRPCGRRPSFCEFKGLAVYFNIGVGDEIEREAAWAYPNPSPGYEAMADHVAVYADRMDLCTVDGEAVTPQPGGFYGGWVTENIVGPFKGGPGSTGW